MSLYRHLRTAALAGFLTGALPLVAPAQQQDMLDRMDRRLDGARDSLIAVRRNIHRHPELSGREERTAGVVAAYLEGLGFQVRNGVGGHGVVGILRGSKPGPVVAFRADMDAVTSHAPDPVDFASVKPGVRHICGHDIHTTVGLGIAEAFAAVHDEVPGTVVLIFQPAEENVQGAKAMIEDGVLEDPAPQAIFAYHSAPLQVGQVGSVEGLALPGLDHFTATFTGGRDPERAAGVFRSGIADLNTPDDVPPADFVRVMPRRTRQDSEGHWIVTGAVRAGSPEARSRVQAWMDGSMKGLEIAGEQGELEYQEFAVVPDMVNDTALVRSTLDTFRSVLGAENLLEINQVTPQFSEDFARFQQHIPGAMYWLGVANAELGYSGMPHSPDFVADEAAIGVGAMAMAAVMLNYLETH